MVFENSRSVISTLAPASSVSDAWISRALRLARWLAMPASIEDWGAPLAQLSYELPAG